MSTKDYTVRHLRDSAKTYTYDATLSFVENAKAMAEKMMLAMGSRKEAPGTVAAEDGGHGAQAGAPSSRSLLLAQNALSPAAASGRGRWTRRHPSAGAAAAWETPRSSRAPLVVAGLPRGAAVAEPHPAPALEVASSSSASMEFCYARHARESGVPEWLGEAELAARDSKSASSHLPKSAPTAGLRCLGEQARPSADAPVSAPTVPRRATRCRTVSSAGKNAETLLAALKRAATQQRGQILGSARIKRTAAQTQP